MAEMEGIQVHKISDVQRERLREMEESEEERDEMEEVVSE